MRGRIGRRGKGRKWMTREEVIGEGTSLDLNGACFVPDLKKHSEKTLTHTERIFIKTLCICIVVMERRRTVFLPGFCTPG